MKALGYLYPLSERGQVIAVRSWGPATEAGVCDPTGELASQYGDQCEARGDTAESDDTTVVDLGSMTVDDWGTPSLHLRERRGRST